MDLEGKSRDADEPECDPAGAVFVETLVGVDPMDQEGLRFAGSGNLSAIRWLLAIGASPKARDRNGTTMLHAACRSGTVSIVQALVRSNLQLDAADCAGWTPLHISAVMGRRDVSLLLLQARANLTLRTKRGLLACDLCSDLGTKEVLAAFSAEVGTAMPLRLPAQQLSDRWPSAVSQDDNAPPCEPFFVPRQALFKDDSFREDTVRIGIQLFQRSPGHGLAFLVAVGAVRDHPTDLGAFLLKHRADPAQLGEFLGEDFSLAQTLRLAFISTVELKGTGIIGALMRAFRHVRLPPDLRKVDRLTGAVAHLWWRMHDLDDEYDADEARAEVEGLDWNMPLDAVTPDAPEHRETTGLELRWCLHSTEGLKRLMFSVVLLCWNMRLSASKSELLSAVSQRRLSMGDWIDLNTGLETDGSNMPVHVQKGIYQTMCNNRLPQLLPSGTSASPLSDDPPEEGLLHEAPLDAVPLPSLGTTFSDGADPAGCRMNVEGWATIPHGGLERLDPLPPGSGPFHHNHCIISETLSSSVQPLPGLVQRSQVVETGEVVWLTLSRSLFIFLSKSAEDASPYAFVRLQDAVVRDIDYGARRLVMAGKLRDMDGEVTNADGDTPHHLQQDEKMSNASPFGDPRLPLSLCFLLADGRFQLFDALWLELQFSCDEDLVKWSKALGVACQMPPPPPEASRDSEVPDEHTAYAPSRWRRLDMNSRPQPCEEQPATPAQRPGHSRMRSRDKPPIPIRQPLHQGLPHPEDMSRAVPETPTPSGLPSTPFPSDSLPVGPSPSGRLAPPEVSIEDDALVDDGAVDLGYHGLDPRPAG